MSQVAIGEEVKCGKCGASFEVKKDMAEDAHLVTMAAVDLQVKQMEMMQRVGRIAPPQKKKITVSTPQARPKSGGGGAGKVILYIILLIVIAIAVLAGLHLAGVLDLQTYFDKIKGLLGA
jgi:hypothetical protein